MDLVTAKEQRNRLNMVRLAFLLSSEVSGPGADELLPAVRRVCVCTQAWLCVHAPLQVMWNVIANRTWCQFDVRALSATEGFAGGLVLVECFSSLIACICSGFHVQRNFPSKPAVFHENHKILCESVCERKRGGGGGRWREIGGASNVLLYIWALHCPRMAKQMRKRLHTPALLWKF